MWLRIFKKVQNVDYVKSSYLEHIQFTQNNTTDISLKHRLILLKLQGVTQLLTQLSLALHWKVLKQASSSFERNPTPQPAYKAPITALFGYTHTVQSQYEFPYNPYNLTHKLRGVAEISAFEPLVVPEASQYQVSTNLKMILQNVNRSSHVAGLLMGMNPERISCANTQTTINSSKHLDLSNKSRAIDVRFNEERLSSTSTSALT